METEQIEKEVQQAVARLSEIVPHIQVFVSWNKDEITHFYKLGAGNWYARQGMAHSFINQDIAQDNAVQISECLNGGME